MNERNVAALAKLLEGLCGVPYDFGAIATCDKVAAFLSSRGVLVPASLTDEQTYELGCHDRETCMCRPEDIKFGAERIAKGEV